MSERFEIDGLAVRAVPVGNSGWYFGVPENLVEALKRLVDGSLLTGPRVVKRLEEPKAEPAKGTEGNRGTPGNVGTPRPEYQKPPFPPAPKWTPPTPQSETITQFRNRTGMSRSKTADMLNISRRTLGRWEQKGKRMAEV